MIKNIQIKNFKSIKNLDLDCNRINLFIGEPNAGKSNILEAIGLLSFQRYGSIGDFIRMESMSDLFNDENLDEKIEVKFDGNVLEIFYEKERFIGRCYKESSKDALFSWEFDHDGRGSSSNGEPIPVKFYKFKSLDDFRRKEADFLLPPFGDNLYSILRNHRHLREDAVRIFEPFGLKLVFRHQEKKIEIMKQQGDFIVTYPYSLASDTLQRIVFYMTVINSNKDSILVLEEPESHTFPYYTKSLGELIAFDDRNQYFIATHNPYLLLAILEKAKKNTIGVFVTYFRDYQTKVKRLTDNQISELINYDPFFNLDHFIGDDTQ